MRRGPTNANKAAEGIAYHVGFDLLLKKRSRLLSSTTAGSSPSGQMSSNRNKNKKRGNPSTADNSATTATSAPEPEVALRKRRGRPSNVTVLGRKVSADISPNQPEPKKKQGRPPNANKTPATSLQDSGTIPKKKRGQPSHVEPIMAGGSDRISSSVQTKKKRGRPSNASLAEREAPAVANHSTSTEPRQGKKRRTRDDQHDHSPTEKRRRISQQDGSQESRRESENQSGLQLGENEADPSQTYQHLAPKTRRIPRHAIDTKWLPLPSNAVSRISQLLHDVERPVVMRLHEERKRVQAGTAVQTLIRKLEGKLNRGLPFPPGSHSKREEEFDFERILDSTRILEAQLTTMLHSIGLLKAQRRKEQLLLEADQTNLDQLEEAARSESSLRKKTVLKVHPLLKSTSHAGGQDDTLLDICLTDTAAGELCPLDVRLMHLFRDTSTDVIQGKLDEALHPVMDQLKNHLESIQTNVAQVHGISLAMSKTKAAVDDVLYAHLELHQYDRVANA